VVLAANNIAREDVEAIKLVDEPEQVLEIVTEYHDRAVEHGQR
jgi:hypothetical protein